MAFIPAPQAVHFGHFSVIVILNFLNEMQAKSKAKASILNAPELLSDAIVVVYSPGLYAIGWRVVDCSLHHYYLPHDSSSRHHLLLLPTHCKGNGSLGIQSPTT